MVALFVFQLSSADTWRQGLILALGYVSLGCDRCICHILQDHLTPWINSIVKQGHVIPESPATKCAQMKKRKERELLAQEWLSSAPDLSPVFLSSACGPYSKHCLWIITHECTQASHTGEGDTWSQLPWVRISGLKCTGGKGTLNAAWTARRQWLLINQRWQGLSGLLLDQTLVLRMGSFID